MHEISNNIYVSSTQFERPFDYSSSTWVHTDNECDKNANKFKVAHHHFNQSEVGQSVTAIVHASAEPYRYFLKSADSPPYIRFTVPGS